jgi:F-type H+-transporting ATPase subunit gamma
MPSLKDIRKRISSVKNTQKITRALKLVSAAKLSRSQREMSRLKPYASKQKELIRNLVSELGDETSALFEHPNNVKTEQDLAGKKIAVLLICSDRGMCGGFNSNLLKLFRRFATEKIAAGAEVSCWSLGRRAEQFIKKEGFTLAGSYGLILAPTLIDQIPEIAQHFIDRFEAGDFDQVEIISNRFFNAITQTPEIERFLPIPSDLSGEENTEKQPKGDSCMVDRIYEPDQKVLLDFIIPRALETQTRQAILESITGEHAARMNAMNNATDNASDMINTLTLDLNRARQAAITAELMEIISGAEALK